MSGTALFSCYYSSDASGLLNFVVKSDEAGREM
jgi:hypothetical protein